MRRFIPWYARVAAKVVLSRVPASYALWRRLNVFSHGAMHRADYALGVFQHHFARLPPQSGTGPVLLEIGPGDSLLSAVIGAAHGASRVHLVDAGPFATADLHPYRDAEKTLRSKGLNPPSLEGVTDLDGVLSACHASYGTRGLASMKEIPGASVDLIWSQAVLEHIRRNEFDEFLRETRRVLKPHGLCSHLIDLKDHLGGALNNMRLPSRLWEAEWMARSGFYTNRMRRSEMLRSFESAGFTLEVLGVTRWDALPTPHAALAREFRHFDADELLVKEFEVIGVPA